MTMSNLLLTNTQSLSREKKRVSFLSIYVISDEVRITVAS